MELVRGALLQAKEGIKLPEARREPVVTYVRGHEVQMIEGDGSDEYFSLSLGEVMETYNIVAVVGEEEMEGL